MLASYTDFPTACSRRCVAAATCCSHQTWRRTGRRPVSTFLEPQGVDIDARLPFKREALGDVDDSGAGTVVYDGPFVVTKTDKHPFLVDEPRWIEQCSPLVHDGPDSRREGPTGSTARVYGYPGLNIDQG